VGLGPGFLKGTAARFAELPGEESIEASQRPQREPKGTTRGKDHHLRSTEANSETPIEERGRDTVTKMDSALKSVRTG
jgi:hypothetical protein